VTVGRRRREVGVTTNMAVKVQMVLLAVGIGAACVVMLGGIFGKSWRGRTPGGGRRGLDGRVKPWARLGDPRRPPRRALCSSADSSTTPLGWLRGLRRSSLRHAAIEATAYRDRLEADMFTMYDHHTLSFGLRVVPTAGESARSPSVRSR
jgi:hypothetical protein